jgi:putative SOS response-associated peptidase YedK
MCGKASVSHLSWKDVYAWATSLSPPSVMPADPATRINVSPSRLRRKSEPDSMLWETLPVIYREHDCDQPGEAIWPYIPAWAGGRLPYNSAGKLISTANARLRYDNRPFAPTFMHSWNRDMRVLVIVSWFYEFDSRVKPQIPWAVFPLQMPYWVMAGLASKTRLADGSEQMSVAIITVEPNRVLKSVGHHRSPALLRDAGEAKTWLSGERDTALGLLRPFPEESMGVETIPMGIKIPGNQDIRLPGVLTQGGDV